MYRETCSDPVTRSSGNCPNCQRESPPYLSITTRGTENPFVKGSDALIYVTTVAPAALTRERFVERLSVFLVSITILSR